MDLTRHPEALLGPYRVLDLTDRQGFLAGKLLGDLGTDVIKIEPPSGDAGRRVGPFYHDDPHPERSLSWMAFNLNKRGITLNLEHQDGRALFRRMVPAADFVIESFPPGYLSGLGLGYEELSAINPRIIVAAITPFGQSGPYHSFKSAPLINEALGGFMYVSGDEDRPPVQISFPVSYCHAGAEAAAACAMAHYYREQTGKGQFIDVSIQQCVVWTLMNTTTTWDLLQADVMRGSGSRVSPQTGLRVHTVWPCQDGYVVFALMVGPLRGPAMRALVEWMDREGTASPHVKGVDWESLDLRAMAQEQYDALATEVGALLMTKTMAQLYEYAVQAHLVLAPILGARDVLESPQLGARGSLVALEHPELGEGVKLIYPNAFVKLSAWSPRIFRRAPHLGEHNQEIYCGELGLSPQQLLALAQAGAI